MRDWLLDGLATVGALFLGASIYLALGLAATLAYAGALLIGLALAMAVLQRRRQ